MKDKVVEERYPNRKEEEVEEQAPDHQRYRQRTDSAPQ
jgi:hypothetical protein